MIVPFPSATSSIASLSYRSFSRSTASKKAVSKNAKSRQINQPRSSFSW